jgi:hypothetical protein
MKAIQTMKSNKTAASNLSYWKQILQQQ